MRLMPLIAAGLVVGLGVGWWLRSGDSPPAVASAATEASSSDGIGPARPEPLAPTAVSGAPLTLEPARPSTLSPPTAPAIAPSGLLLPVQGIQPTQLQDTFTDARSEGRVHDAIDILAAEGTPVLAVADGRIEKLFDSDRGGLTIYQFEPGGTYCYYYAHLQRYADGLAEKQQVKRGEVIGYVGSTGNANAEAPHLHFEVHVLGPEKEWWKGESINPYPLLGGRAG